MSVRNSISILKKIYIPHVTPLLGRWNMHNSEETTLKIKYANEDNCGLSSNNENIIRVHQNNELDDDKEYIYMMGYESVHK